MTQEKGEYMKNIKLRNAIREVYRTDSEFGMSIGWVPQRVSKMINGHYIPKITEAVKISDALHMPIDEFANFF